jgi:hypothetical protein
MEAVFPPQGMHPEVDRQVYEVDQDSSEAA